MKINRFSITVCCLIAFFGLSGCASMPADSTPLYMQQVHDVPGKNADELCASVRDWVTLATDDPDKTLKLVDSQNNRIISNGSTTASSLGYTWPVKFQFVVECKDERLRTTYQDFQIRGTSGYVPLVDDGMNNYKSKTEAKILLIDAAIAKYANNPTFGDDW